MEGKVEMPKIARFATIAAFVGILGFGVTGPALADTGNFGQKCTCAQA
jgi:hypothetical protein